MLPPLVSRLVSDPSLAVEHARRYAALAEAELALASQVWQRRLVAAVAAVVLLAAGLMLAGVALLVAQGPGAASADWQAGWLFWAVPVLPLLLGGAAALVAAQSPHPLPFATLRAQLADDAALLLPPSAADAADAACAADSAGPHHAPAAPTPPAAAAPPTAPAAESGPIPPVSSRAARDTGVAS